MHVSREERKEADDTAQQKKHTKQPASIVSLDAARLGTSFMGHV